MRSKGLPVPNSLSPVTVVRSDAVQPDQVPPTPASLEGADLLAPAISDRFLELITDLGIPIGFPREQDGRLIQDLFPIASAARRQVSTSSLVDLGMHTETAFHPFKPDYVVLLCLRGDPEAHTTHAAVEDIVSNLSDDDIGLLSQDRFTTTIDESFMSHGESDRELPVIPLEIRDSEIRLVFDEKLMRETDEESQSAFERLSEAVARSVRTTVLDAGDLLIIDNHRAVHGRSRFAPRFNGTDRWLRRAMVLREAPPATDFDGRLVTTTF